MYQFGFLKRGKGGFGGGGSTAPTPTVPQVMSSRIPIGGDGIIVVFDQAMKMTKSLQDAITVKVDGGVTVKADHIEITPDGTSVGIIFPMHFFKPGQVVTWAYNDQHATEKLSGAVTGGLEADNQTYAVINEALVKTPIVVSSEIYANNPNRIVVIWDREMHGDPDIHLNMEVIKNGGAPLLAKAVIFAGKNMMMTLNTPATSTDTYEWAFNNIAQGAVLADKNNNMADTKKNQVVNKTPAATPPPPPADDILDLDGDGKPDEVRGEFGKVLITEDSDSVNVDVDGDGVADIVIAKPKPKRKPRKKPVKRKQK